MEECPCAAKNMSRTVLDQITHRGGFSVALTECQPPCSVADCFPSDAPAYPRTLCLPRRSPGPVHTSKFGKEAG